MFIFLTVKLFQSLVSSECSRLVEAATEKLSVKVEEQNSEIRKLKAMIGEQMFLSFIIAWNNETWTRNRLEMYLDRTYI